MLWQVWFQKKKENLLSVNTVRNGFQCFHSMVTYSYKVKVHYLVLKNKMCSILVTGANRGIGLGLVKHLLSNQAFNVENVFATCRDMGKAKVINIM